MRIARPKRIARSLRWRIWVWIHLVEVWVSLAASSTVSSGSSSGGLGLVIKALRANLARGGQSRNGHYSCSVPPFTRPWLQIDDHMAIPVDRQATFYMTFRSLY